MRIRSDIFVSALIRRGFSAGGFAAVVQKGAEAAGAIFIRQRFRDGLESVYGPAPQTFARDDDGMRRFEARLARAEPSAVDAVVGRESRFDSDLWVVELELDEIGDLFEIVKPDEA
ncbi:DUF1491 family protein [Neorhizobium sp. JUb45]|uniref:DUF1491 family protein n=1 Tax=unclassified Neorhizobium TaxID=2629175 RepID=UPI001047A6D1|nr:DUF1491 family protein [Neorhizobium sp. JUb45]TCR06730.1 hypothetical protein EDF70_101691 [Neorhizobium sp. JUb45]